MVKEQARKEKKQAMTPARRIVQSQVKDISRDGALLGRYASAICLPAESAPLRYMDVSGCPTNVFKLSSATPISVPDDTKGLTYLFADTQCAGTMVYMSRQPSRMLGWKNVLNTGRTLTAFWDQSLVNPADIPQDRPLVEYYIPEWARSIYRSQGLVAGIIGQNLLTYPEDITPWRLGNADKTIPSGESCLAFSERTTPNRWIWCDKGTVITITVKFMAAKLSLASSKGYYIYFPFCIDLWMDNVNVVEDARNAMASANTNSWTTTPTDYSCNCQITVPVDGWYSLKALPQHSSYAVTPDVTYGWSATSVHFSITLVRPGGSYYWMSAPEMAQNAQAYKTARLTAAATLLTNVTNNYSKGGSIHAVLANDESNAIDYLLKKEKFLARAGQKTNRGYTGPLAKGLYTWLRPGSNDYAFHEFADVEGTPYYRLDMDTPVTLTWLESNTATPQAFMAHVDVHLESEVPDSQMYGLARLPGLPLAEFNRLTEAMRAWPIWHENPTHWQEYVRKIAGIAWKAAKLSAPHFLEQIAMLAL